MPVKKKGKWEPGDFKFVVKRSSPGAGLGLFTASPIPKGACVIEYVGRVVSKEESESSRSKYLFEITKTKTIDGKPKWNKAGYINHSHAPNCEAEIHAGRVFIRSKKNIKPGEELSYDYGKEYVDEHITPYGCRCVKCAKKKGK